MFVPKNNLAEKKTELTLAKTAEQAITTPGSGSRLRTAKEKALLGVMVFLFLLLFSFPLIQLTVHPLKEDDLHGIALPNHFPKLRLEKLMKESFQKRAEDWFMKRNGLYALLVRTSNQLTFSTFNQISSNYYSPAMLGKEGHFFQPMYLQSFNRSKNVDRKELEERADKLKELQDILAKHGIPLVVLISTNILALHPELAAEEYTDPTRLQRENSYDVLRPLLVEKGVNIVDAHEYLTKLKGEMNMKFFEPTASHWNNVAACKVTSQLITKFEALLGKNMINIGCDSYSYQFPPKGADRDLVQIANLLYPEQAMRPAPYVQREVTKDGSEFRPKILFVGTSFIFSVLDQLDDNDISEKNSFFFYYRQVKYNSKEGHYKRLNRRSIDWKKVLNYDLIVLERNMASIGNMGFSFLDDAIEHLKETPAVETKAADSTGGNA